jgi:hypothetical protein
MIKELVDHMLYDHRHEFDDHDELNQLSFSFPFHLHIYIIYCNYSLCCRTEDELICYNFSVTAVILNCYYIFTRNKVNKKLTN